MVGKSSAQELFFSGNEEKPKKQCAWNCVVFAWCSKPFWLVSCEFLHVRETVTMAVFDCELRLPAFLVVLFALGFSAALVCASEGNVLIPAIAAVTGGLCCGAAFLALSAGAGQAASTQTALISRVCRLEAEVATHIPGAVIRNPEMAPLASGAWRSEPRGGGACPGALPPEPRNWIQAASFAQDGEAQSPSL